MQRDRRSKTERQQEDLFHAGLLNP